MKVFKAFIRLDTGELIKREFYIGDKDKTPPISFAKRMVSMTNSFSKQGAPKQELIRIRQLFKLGK